MSLVSNEAVHMSKPKKVGGPRLDPYNRLICRFYEPLIFLAALGKTRGHHTEPPNASPREAVYRRFLCNLAFVCDFDKGGPTTTAIAVEERSGGNVIWLATNEFAHSEKVAKHLTAVLKTLRDVCNSSNPDAMAVAELMSLLLLFAKKRIKKEGSLLRRDAGELANSLGRGVQVSIEGTRLGIWLRKFHSLDDTDPLRLCRLAYDNRRAREVNEIQGFLQEHNHTHADESASTADDERRTPLSKFRHSLGRLAHHIRATGTLVEDARQLGYLLNRLSVEQVSSMPAVSVPVPDQQTSLDGILRRMVSQKLHPRQFQQLSAGLEILDHKFGIYKRFVDAYKPESSAPQVHCEIRILEHFYKNKLRYLDDHRYIGCSKPACFCCQLYIRHHPARCVVPESHQNIYPRWGPPRLEGGSQDPAYVHQRDILNNMVCEIREQAKDQIQRLACPQQYHPDSVTGITASDLLPVAPSVEPNEYANSTSGEGSATMNRETDSETDAETGAETYAETDAETDAESEDESDGGVALKEIRHSRSSGP